MISLKKLRNQTELCKKSILLKENDIDLDNVLALDKKLRELKTISNDMRADRNNASESIGELKKAGKDASESIKKTRELGDELKKIEHELNDIEKTLSASLYRLPNMPHESVPRGNDETDNRDVRTWGSMPDFKFKPKSHLELGEQLGLFDFLRGAKLSGSGFPLYTGVGAKLERKLINSMIEHHEKEFGFTEIFPPILMKRESMLTTGQLPKFEEDMYHTEVDNLYLAPTAEVPVTNIHRNEIINEQDLIYFLKKNKHSSYFTDVLSREYDGLKKSKIFKFSKKKPKQIFITPHIGGMTDEGQSMAYHYSLKKLRNFQKNG